MNEDQLAGLARQEAIAKMAEMMRMVASTIYHASEAPGTLTDAQWRAVLRVLAGYLSGLSAGQRITQEDVVRHLSEAVDAHQS